MDTPVVSIPLPQLELLLSQLKTADEICRMAEPTPHDRDWYHDEPTRYYHGAVGWAAGTLHHAVSTLELYLD